jgi:hypothetical protein
VSWSVAELFVASSDAVPAGVGYIATVVSRLIGLTIVAQREK